MLNACGAFIPTSVSIPVIRDKTVLNICDAIQGLYHGGPNMNEKRRQFIWEHKRMYFATDPVALDKIGWEELDKSGRAFFAAEAPSTQRNNGTRMNTDSTTDCFL